MGVDDDVHLALPVEQYLARAMAGERVEAEHLQHLPQRLGPARGKLDEFDAVHLERVARFGGEFAIGQPCHLSVVLALPAQRVIALTGDDSAQRPSDGSDRATAARVGACSRRVR